MIAAVSPRISVVITTLDEEIHVERAVRAARLLTDDVLLIDSGSTDATLEIGTRLGARTMIRPFDDMASQRNAALRSGGLTGDYTLFQDADEMVTEAFARALVGLLAADPGIDGVRICRKFHFWGRWVKSASRFPRYIDRVVRMGKVTFRKDGHGEVFEGGARYVLLDEPLHDENLKPLTELVARQNRYARMEAAEDIRVLAGTPPPASRRRRTLARARRTPGWPTAIRAYYLFVRGGVFEGRAGRAYCGFRAMAEYMIQLHVRDLIRRR